MVTLRTVIEGLPVKPFCFLYSFRITFASSNAEPPNGSYDVESIYTHTVKASNGRVMGKCPIIASETHSYSSSAAWRRQDRR